LSLYGVLPVLLFCCCTLVVLLLATSDVVFSVGPPGFGVIGGGVADVVLVVLAGACPAVILAACAAVVSAGNEPNVGTRSTPGMSCAVARCCCSSKMLGQIANSKTAPILKIMPKEALDIISQYRECQLYK
jgi:hypothetical protein